MKHSVVGFGRYNRRNRRASRRNERAKRIFCCRSRLWRHLRKFRLLRFTTFTTFHYAPSVQHTSTTSLTTDFATTQLSDLRYEARKRANFGSVKNGRQKVFLIPAGYNNVTSSIECLARLPTRRKTYPGNTTYNFRVCIARWLGGWRIRMNLSGTLYEQVRGCRELCSIVSAGAIMCSRGTVVRRRRPVVLLLGASVVARRYGALTART
jgi:hypothetical protein